MRVLAVWSALAGGAACATVAAVEVERMGGIETVFTTLQETVAPQKTPDVAKAAPAPTPAASTKLASLEPPSATPEAAKPQEAPGAPAFDVVRVEPSGDTVVAGHAAPRATVELRDGAKVVGKATADDSGQFVILPDPLPQGEHALRLTAQGEKGAELTSKVASVKVEAGVAVAAAKPLPAPKASAVPPVAVAVPTPSPTARPSAIASPSAPLAAAPQAAPDASPSATTLALAAAPAAANAPKPTPSTNTSAAAPTPTPAPSPSQAMLAPPAQTAIAAPSALAPPGASGAAGDLKIVQAKPNAAGGLEARGDAAPGERVRLTLNGAFIADVVANALGRWSLTVERGLTAGLYALRAQAVEPGGATGPSTDATFAYAPKPGAATPDEPASPAIVGAAPAPFAPASPGAMLNTATIAGAPVQPITPAAPIVIANADPSHAVIAELRTATVIKGDNLWDLARHYYGDGLRFADIFHANSSLIHNPNLIYIGQVFVVPQDADKTR